MSALTTPSSVQLRSQTGRRWPTGADGKQREAILEVEDLVTVFSGDAGDVRAVDGASFSIAAGEAVALVGESGSGKSVTALSILQLISSPGRVASGSIRFRGTDLTKLSEKEMRAFRGSQVAMIFQEPMTSLNPVLTVGNQLVEAIRLHTDLDRSAAKKKAAEMLDLVSIPDPVKRLDDYPHQMSGGMRQRVMIAMALSCDPELLIADEPTTALDVTIQAQVMELMGKLQKELGLAVLLITHDLGVVAEFCERVVVMYTGRIVEEAPVNDLFATPQHPYTRGLLASLPNLAAQAEHGRAERLSTIPGMVPDIRNLPSGCKFHPRCPDVMPHCSGREPARMMVGDDHDARCYLHGNATVEDEKR